MVVTGRNEVVAKVMFLHKCVILFTGGVWADPPGTMQTLPQQGEPPQDQADTPPRDQADTPHPAGRIPPAGRTPPPGTRQTPPQDQADPPPGRRLQHTVNERPVCILLECILVFDVQFQVAL